MKKVIRTKEFSFKQIENMVQNLRDKFQVTASIKIDYFAHYPDKERYEYFFWVKDTYSKFHSFWKEIQDTYFELMEQ